MKNITQFINESTQNLKKPKIDEYAYCWGDKEWQIIDFCQVKDTEKMKELLEKYDSTRHYCDGDYIFHLNDNAKPNDYVVAAICTESFYEPIYAVFNWSEYEFYYKQ